LNPAPTYIPDRVWFCDKDKQVYQNHQNNSNEEQTMPTPNNNNSITYLESALLAEDVYKENAENRGVNGWKPQKHGSLDSSSGCYCYSDDFGLVVALRRSLNALNRLLGSYWALS
jgi:hypothetical protein